MIDTELWVLAKKKPSKEKFKSEEDYKVALNAHKKIANFFLKEVPILRIYITSSSC